MDYKLNRKLIIYIFIVSYICINLSNVIGQIGLNIPDPYSKDSKIVSTGFIYSIPVLTLRNWYDTSDKYIELRPDVDNYNINNFISRDFLPKNPFEIDYRGSSYYVPRQVRDDLNLIMNRPRETAFMPVLTVAFLALQMASKYLAIDLKKEITAQNIEDAQSALPVLKELWKKSPQTITELYKRESINKIYTMFKLTEHIDLLMDNKLVRRREFENAETKYSAAIDEMKYKSIKDKVLIIKKKQTLEKPEKSIEINKKP